MPDKRKLASVLLGDQAPVCPKCGSTKVVATGAQDHTGTDFWGCLACNHSWSTPRVYERPLAYRVTIWPETCACPDSGRWCLTVTRRDGQWAIIRGTDGNGMELGIDGTFSAGFWLAEDRGKWIAAHRFTREQALRVARFYAGSIVIAGKTAAEALADHQRNFPEGCNA